MQILKCEECHNTENLASITMRSTVHLIRSILRANYPILDSKYQNCDMEIKYCIV